MSEEKVEDGNGEDDEADADESSEGADEFATTSEVQVIVRKPYVDPPFAWFLVPLVLTTAIGLAFHFALGPGVTSRLVLPGAVGSIYLVFAIAALFRMSRKHELSSMRPRSGDMFVAAIVAAILWGGGWAGATLLMPRGSAHEGWLLHVYAVIGDAFTDKRPFVSIALLFIGAVEEIAWRGLVQETLETKVSRRNAALITAACWAISHAPTLYRLGDPISGPNPLLVAAAFGSGITWSYLKYRTDRLAPAVISHALFSWAIVEFPLWHP